MHHILQFLNVLLKLQEYLQTGNRLLSKFFWEGGQETWKTILSIFISEILQVSVSLCHNATYTERVHLSVWQ